LDALLLFALPLLLTLAKFVAETTLRSHQFARCKGRPDHFPVFKNLLSALRTPL
jgi:hypothetical protein